MRSLTLIALACVVTACADIPGDTTPLKPDLKIKSASVGARRIAIGHELPMSIVIKNKNSAKASVTQRFQLSAVVRVPHSEGQEAIVEKVRFDAPRLGASIPVYFVDIDDDLIPKQTAEITTKGYVKAFPSGSDVEFVVTVDPKNEIDEIDELNNTNQRRDPVTGAILDQGRTLITLP